MDWYTIVPWFNVKEWHDVFENLYSEKLECKEKALKQILIWKARSPSLPSGIESTLCLLEVFIQDGNNHDMGGNDQLLRLAYSSAIMRFVNHMFDEDAAKGSTLYRIAKERGIPDWIVELRHNTAHSSNLPSLELLREATSICLQWLHDNYWIVHKEVLKDCIVDKSSMLLIRPEEDVYTVFNLCIMLSFCSHPNNRIKNVSDMPKDMQQSVINDSKELFGDKISFAHLKKVSVKALLSQLNTFSKQFFKNINKEQVCKHLLRTDSLFLSFEVYKAMSNNSKSEILHKDYVKCFEGFLNFLTSHNLIEEFMLQLLLETEAKEIDDKRAKLAAQWASEILKALRKTQMFLERAAERKMELETKQNKELNYLFNHWFPNEKSCPLLLDLCKPVPPSLMDINRIRPIISTYNSNLRYFILDLLNLVRPKLPTGVTKKICKMAELIAFPEKFPTEVTKIYTVDDLKSDRNYDNPDMKESEDCFIVKDSEDSIEYGIWKMASRSVSWASCPIGLLPWQVKDSNVMDID